MKKSHPLLSIIIPTYNSEKFIGSSLKSIENQIFHDFEVLILDGLSTDKTLDIAKGYQSDITQLYIYSEKDTGVYDAMNKGVDLAKGKWIFFLGSDDEFYDNTVLTKIAKYIDSEKWDFVYGNVLFKELKISYDGEFDIIKLTRNNICHQAIFYNREIFKKIGKFNPDYKVFADWDFNIRCFFSKNIRIKYVNTLIAIYADGGLSARITDAKFKKDIYIKILKLGFSKLPVNELVSISYKALNENKDHKWKIKFLMLKKVNIFLRVVNRAVLAFKISGTR